MKTYRGEQFGQLAQVQLFSKARRHEMAVVASVLPFKVNDYVVNNLIDWADVPDDPIYRLTFPDRDMLPPEVFESMSKLIRGGADRKTLARAAAVWRRQLNPHPAGQTTENVPAIDGLDQQGLQHKYRETVLVFPSQGQTCHSYCGYCFRWAQFVGDTELKFSMSEPALLFGYLKQHSEVTDVLFTGGDPLIMSTAVLRKWIEPLLLPEFEHVQTIRLGTKALTYWPYRVTAEYRSELLRLIEQCSDAGKHVAVMLHISHPRELEALEARKAVLLMRSAGAVLRLQAPIIKHVNDDSAVWAELWQHSVQLGICPYYAFVERDTGANVYFEVPLQRSLQIFRDAQRTVSGLARTARGPVMSTTPGKIVIDGEMTIEGQRVFALRMLQAREPRLVGQVFFAAHSSTASWIDDLRPAFAERWPWE